MLSGLIWVRSTVYSISGLYGRIYSLFVVSIWLPIRSICWFYSHGALFLRRRKEKPGEV